MTTGYQTNYAGIDYHWLSTHESEGREAKLDGSAHESTSLIYFDATHNVYSLLASWKDYE